MDIQLWHIIAIALLYFAFSPLVGCCGGITMTEQLIDLSNDTKPTSALSWAVIIPMILGIALAVYLWLPYYHWANTEPSQAYMYSGETGCVSASYGDGLPISSLRTEQVWYMEER